MGKLVGFDIGENSVKMVYFSGRELKRAITAELPDAMVSNGRILSMDAMADFIRDMAKGYGIPLTNAAMVLNTGDHFVRSVTLPLMTEQQLRYNLPYEFRDFLTEEKNRYFFDYSMQGILNGSDGQPEKMELFACAMLKSSVEEYRAMFRRAGFRQRVLTPDESAYGALLEEHIAHHGGEDTDRCIVSLGHRSTFSTAAALTAAGAWRPVARSWTASLPTTAAWMSMWPTAISTATITACWKPITLRSSMPALRARSSGP